MRSRCSGFELPQPVCEPRYGVRRRIVLCGRNCRYGSGAADVIEYRVGPIWDGASSPRDVLVGTDENQVTLIEHPGMIIADVHHFQWHPALGGRVLKSGDIDVGEPQEGKAGPQQIEDRLAVLKEQARRTRPRLRTRRVGVHVIGQRGRRFVTDE